VTFRHSRLRVNLLIHVHTAGLRRDLQVWRHAFKAIGVDATFTTFNPMFHARAIRAVKKMAGRFSARPPFDVNIFVEDIAESWCSLACVNVFVPHQEWVFDEIRSKVGLMDYVFCKTRYAESVFSAAGSDARFIGFTSVDRYDDSVVKDYGRFLHIAGSSLQKGTATLNEAWQGRPDWPQLTLLSYEPTMRLSRAPNIAAITDFVNDAALRRMQNSMGLHLCTSEAEGFGHYIVEAMSTGAVVVTTDAPPMNELVETSRGVLVGYNRTAPQGMGTNFYIDPADLVRKVDWLLGTEERERRQWGENARLWYHENEGAFLGRLRAALEGVA
jgi:glycosyltransferase involved in cell wall biosynthesis